MSAYLIEADLYEADLYEADLSYANLSKADLTKARPETALSLKATKMIGVKGLTEEQREACIKKGAIFDSSDQPPIPDANESISRSDTSS